MKATIQNYRKRFQDKARAEKYAKRFERNSHRGIDRRERDAVQKIFCALECGSVLDVPCGAGRFGSSLAQHGRRLIEMDVSLEILQHAAKNAAKAHAPAVFAQGDASRLPLADASVDAIFCNRLLHHILDKSERAIILRELYRVARRYIVVSFFDYRSFGGVRSLLKRIKGSKTNYHLQPTLEDFQQEVESCGFRVREIVPTGALWVSQKFFVLERKPFNS